MSKTYEATENGGKIFLTGWFRTSLIGFSGLMVTVLTMLVSSVAANNTKHSDKISTNEKSIAKLEVQYMSIQSDLTEIKHLLRRAIP